MDIYKGVTNSAPLFSAAPVQSKSVSFAASQASVADSFERVSISSADKLHFGEDGKGKAKAKKREQAAKKAEKKKKPLVPQKA